jgi:hypothetical protein
MTPSSLEQRLTLLCLRVLEPQLGAAGMPHDPVQQPKLAAGEEEARRTLVLPGLGVQLARLQAAQAAPLATAG